MRWKMVEERGDGLNKLKVKVLFENGTSDSVILKVAEAELTALHFAWVSSIC